MSKILIILLTVFTAVPFTSISAQEPADYFVSSAENLTCAEVLPDNSVIASFFNVSTLGLETMERDSSVDLPIRVSNSNAFSVQNVTVHARVFKTADSEGRAVAPQLHSTHVVEQNVTLDGGESVELNYPYTIPSALANGMYSLSMYVESNQRFSLSGTTAYEMNPNQSVEFALLQGQAYGSMIDRSSLQVNSTPYTLSDDTRSAITSSTVVNGIDTTQIEVIVKNASGTSPTLGVFTWNVFIGDQPNPVTQIDSQNVPIKLVPGTQTKVSYQLLNPRPLPYTLVGTLNVENSDSQSIVISFAEDGTVSARPSVVDPIDFATFVKNDDSSNSTDMLFCYTPVHVLQYEDPALHLSVSGATGVIGKYSVDLSDLPYSQTSIADRFSFPSVPGTYTVDISLLSSDRVVSTSTMQYTNPSPETKQILEAGDNNSSNAIRAAGLVLVGLLIFGLFLYRRSFTKLEN